MFPYLIGGFLPVAVIAVLLMKFREWCGWSAAVLLNAVAATVLLRYTGIGLQWVVCGALVAMLIVMVARLFVTTGEDRAKAEEEAMQKAKRVKLNVTKGRAAINDITYGLMVIASSGSGKTKSVLRDVLAHFAKYNYSGVINDYKNFELTELAGTLFQNSTVRFDVFAVHDPERSVRLNPIAPRYITSENVLRSVISNLFLNLDDEVKGDRFFRNAAESLMVGLIWRLHKEFPDYCHLPFLVAMLLQVNSLHGDQAYQHLIKFINEDPESAMKASTFLSGIPAEKQTAAVYGSLSLALQKLDTPNVFFLLSRDEYDLDIFKKENRRVLSVVNKPGPEETCQLPINAFVMDVVLNQVERGMDLSFSLLEEGPTLKQYMLDRRIATLREFGMAHVYVMQGMSQLEQQWGGDTVLRSIMQNLNTHVFGKINDMKMARFIEDNFELIKEEQKSFSSGGVLGGGERVTTSQRERRKMLGFELRKLKPGQFVLFSDDGTNKVIRFKKASPEKYDAPKIRNITPEEIRQYYTDICREAREFIRKF